MSLSTTDRVREALLRGRGVALFGLSEGRDPTGYDARRLDQVLERIAEGWGVRCNTGIWNGRVARGVRSYAVLPALGNAHSAWRAQYWKPRVLLAAVWLPGQRLPMWCYRNSWRVARVDPLVAARAIGHGVTVIERPIQP